MNLTVISENCSHVLSHNAQNTQTQFVLNQPASFTAIIPGFATQNLTHITRAVSPINSVQAMSRSQSINNQRKSSSFQWLMREKTPHHLHQLSMPVLDTTQNSSDNNIFLLFSETVNTANMLTAGWERLRHFCTDLHHHCLTAVSRH